jgi:hypothetical protein
MTQMTTKLKGERKDEGINITIPDVGKECEHLGIVATRLLGHVSTREVANTIDLDLRGGSMT